ncbi:PucR family transcriptional regulator [Rhodococcus sp. IEGM 1381]|uniref:PucR family transcriptional regulator n=1 Tax=Rhodococcus sp. IEGM 1381 TaxID=3047085 RepID=UPI0024B7BBB6|nr:PucR family transcriptional regulator [Rhodococcus sp. IEGM 1381]MDI9893167.1 PucR family transcriptional regulator [Rhodococcus sp. IEGM 1381]
MILTVASVLDLEPFDGAGVRVLTGAGHLSREVRWVHASELTDIARYLSGGELLLTAGTGLGETDESQRQYIRDIATAGAAALVVEESGRIFESVPLAAIDEAAKFDLPLVALSREIAFAQVSAKVHEVLTQIRVHTLTREREIEAEFSELLLQGADHLAIVRELARVTGASVVLENIVHQVVAYLGKSQGVNHMVDSWELHSRELHHDDDDLCLRRTVSMRGQPWGWIHLLFNGDRTATELDRFAADRAATTVAVSLLTDRTKEARDDQRSTALITRLMLGDLTGAEFADRARQVGYKLSIGNVVVLVLNHDGQHPGERPGLPYISAHLGDYSLIVLPEHALGSSEVRALMTHTQAGGGISRAVPVENVSVAVTQAQSAATVARSLSNRPVLRFDELGVERILVALGQGPELANFVRDELGPILAFDASAANKLMPTLRAFLDSDGRKSDAAAALFVQRRTLYNRLERISSQLGRSLDEPATRQRLLLAVKGLDLLGSDPASRFGP